MDGIKIGVGVITMGVREINPKLFGRSCGDIFVYTDIDKQGPGKARNKVLSHFKDYDHIFIFDDDCWPTVQGWEAYFIKQYTEHNIHWSGMPIFTNMEIVASENEIIWATDSAGCFQYFSRKGLATIGGYNTAYNRYGFEDGAIRSRAIKAGLTGKYPFAPFPIRGLAYIYSMDICNDSPIANIEMPEKMRLIDLNRLIYRDEVLSDKVFYPYE